MGNVSDKFVEKIKTQIFVFHILFPEIRAFYDVMWNNMVEADRPQTAIQHGACALRDG